MTLISNPPSSRSIFQYPPNFPNGQVSEVWLAWFQEVRANNFVFPPPVTGFALGWDANGNLVNVPNTGADQTAAWTAADNAIRSDLASSVNAAKGPALIGFDDGLVYPAGTVGEDLILPRPVSRGGTGGATAAAALANLGIIDTANEIAISSSVAMDNSYLNKYVVCGSAGTFYSPVLPPAAPVGSHIMIRIDRAMNYLVVLTAGGSDTIDGATTRRMWFGESALLLKNGANSWTKIAGLTIPFAGTIIRTSNQSVSTGTTFAAVDFLTADSPGSQHCWDSTNNRFRCPRDGRWSLRANIPISITNNSTIGTADFGFGKNAAVNTTAPNCFDSYPLPVIASAQRVVGKPAGVFNLVAGDYVEAIVRAISTAANFNVESVTPAIDPTLSYHEVPTW